MNFDRFLYIWGRARNLWLVYIGFGIAGFALTMFSSHLSFAEMWAFSFFNVLFAFIITFLGNFVLVYTGFTLGKAKTRFFDALVFIAALDFALSLTFSLIGLFTNLVAVNISEFGFIFAFSAFSVLVVSAIFTLSYKLGESRISKAASVPKNLSYAGFLPRLGAAIIDEIIVWLPLMLLVILAVFVLGIGKDNIFLALVAGIWLFILKPAYYIYFHKVSGQTIGKQVLGLKVIRVSGKELSWVDSFFRLVSLSIGSSIFSLFLGVFWIAVDKNKQGWHDKVADTFVIHEKKKTSKE